MQNNWHAVSKQETCEKPHFVDWAVWEHGCVHERNVCLDQVGAATNTTPFSSGHQPCCFSVLTSLALHAYVACKNLLVLCVPQ